MAHLRSNMALMFLTEPDACACASDTETLWPRRLSRAEDCEPSPRPRTTRAWPDVRVAATASDVLGSRSARFRSAHLAAPGRSPGFCKSVDVRVNISRVTLAASLDGVAHPPHVFGALDADARPDS